MFAIFLYTSMGLWPLTAQFPGSRFELAKQKFDFPGIDRGTRFSRLKVRTRWMSKFG
jgi:hypothetical protein